MLWIATNIGEIERIESTAKFLKALARDRGKEHPEAKNVRAALSEYDQLVDGGNALPDLDDLTYQQLKTELLKYKPGVNRGAIIPALETKRSGVVKLVQDGRWSAYKLTSGSATNVVLDAYPVLKSVIIPPAESSTDGNIMAIFHNGALAAVYSVAFTGAIFRGPDNNLPAADVIEWSKKHAKTLDMEWLNSSSINDLNHVEAGIKVLHKTVFVGDPTLSLHSTDLHKINPFLSELQELEDEYNADGEAYDDDGEKLANIKPEFHHLWKKRFLELFTTDILPKIKQTATFDANHPSVVGQRQLGSAMGLHKKPKHGVNDAIQEIRSVWTYATHVMVEFTPNGSWKDFPGLIKPHLLEVIKYIEKVSLHLASPEKRRELYKIKKEIESTT